MRSRAKIVLHFIAAIVCGFFVSVGLDFAICRFGGDVVCRNLISPAAKILGTGFEGQLFAWGVTTLTVAVFLSLAFWFLLGKWGPLKHVRD
jgi:hypothetical protein